MPFQDAYKCSRFQDQAFGGSNHTQASGEGEGMEDNYI